MIRTGITTTSCPDVSEFLLAVQRRTVDCARTPTRASCTHRTVLTGPVLAVFIIEFRVKGRILFCTKRLLFPRPSPHVMRLLCRRIGGSLTFIVLFSLLVSSVSNLRESVPNNKKCDRRKDDSIGKVCAVRSNEWPSALVQWC